MQDRRRIRIGGGQLWTRRGDISARERRHRGETELLVIGLISGRAARIIRGGRMHIWGWDLEGMERVTEIDGVLSVVLGRAGCLARVVKVRMMLVLLCLLVMVMLARELVLLLLLLLAVLVDGDGSERGKGCRCRGETWRELMIRARVRVVSVVARSAVVCRAGVGYHRAPR